MDMLGGMFGGGAGANAGASGNVNVGQAVNTAQQANQANQLGGNFSSGNYAGALGNAGQMYANQSGPQSGVMGQAQSLNLQQQQATQSDQIGSNFSSGNYMGAMGNAQQLYSNQQQLNQQQGTQSQGFMGTIGSMGQSIHQGQQTKAQSNQLSDGLSSGNYLGALGSAGQLYGGQTQQAPQTQPTGLAGMMVNSSQAYGNLQGGNYQGAATALGGTYSSYSNYGQPAQVQTQGQTSIGGGAGAQGGFGGIQSALSSGNYGDAFSRAGTTFGSYNGGQGASQGQVIQPQAQTSIGSGAGAQGGFGNMQSSISSGKYGDAFSTGSSTLGSYYGGQGQVSGQTQVSAQAQPAIQTQAGAQSGSQGGFMGGLQGAYNSYQQSGRPY
jgi:hypothetical protein